MASFTIAWHLTTMSRLEPHLIRVLLKRMKNESKNCVGFMTLYCPFNNTSCLILYFLLTDQILRAKAYSPKPHIEAWVFVSTSIAAASMNLEELQIVTNFIDNLFGTADISKLRQMQAVVAYMGIQITSHNSV